MLQSMRCNPSYLVWQLYRHMPCNTEVIPISSDQPDDILAKLQCAKSETCNVIICQHDVWSYGNNQKIIEWIECHPHTKFILQTIGYTNKIHSHNFFEISLPFVYDFIDPNEIKSCTKTHDFSCINNRQAIHRLLLGYKLWENNLLGDMIYSQNWIKEFEWDGLSLMMTPKLPRWMEFRSQLPISWQGEVGNFAHDHSFQHAAYTQAWCNLVTETETEQFGTVTEKTMKPFATKQIPIFLAASGHMAYLEKHGFFVFSHLLPKNFDYASTDDKIQIIFDFVRNMQGGMADICSQYTRELQHNQEWLLSGGFRNSVFNSALKLLDLK